MIQAILAQFPAHAFPLVLASDPDGLLSDRDVLEELDTRGFRRVHDVAGDAGQGDNFCLWEAVDALRPWTLAQPVLVITPRPLAELPYDLWDYGHRVTLSLADIFPRLAYPVVRELTPAQRYRLAEVEGPSKTLGRRRSIAYILEQVYGASPEALADPGALLMWLNDVHADAGPLSDSVRQYLIDTLSSHKAYHDWPLSDLLSDADAFRRFLQGAWQTYVTGKTTGRTAREESERYAGLFDEESVQNGLGALIRKGSLQPVPSEDPESLPSWTRAGLVRDVLTPAVQRLGVALEAIDGRLSEPETWDTWCAVARHWAEATQVIHAGLRLPDEALSAYATVRDALDSRFIGWLRACYTPLGGQRLPEPHHVFHVPHWLAHRRRQPEATGRVALVVLDGLALVDWLSIRAAWADRHPVWRLRDRLLLAQIPTVTSVSRQSLVSGLRPAQLDDLDTTQREPVGWQRFWADEGLSKTSVLYERLALDRAPIPDSLYHSGLVAVCLVDHSIDELAHGVTLGADQMQASVGQWLTEYSPALEDLIDGLLERGTEVYVASDHGHVEATGVGRPNEGILAETRGQRCRLYDDGRIARSFGERFPSSILWADDGLLPGGMHVLMPAGRQAYTTHGDVVVTHGGLTIDEVFVPFVSVTRSDPCP